MHKTKMSSILACFRLPDIDSSFIPNFHCDFSPCSVICYFDIFMWVRSSLDKSKIRFFKTSCGFTLFWFSSSFSSTLLSSRICCFESSLFFDSSFNPAFESFMCESDLLIPWFTEGSLWICWLCSSFSIIGKLPCYLSHWLHGQN